MDIFGIGPLELAFVVLIAIVVLGPKEMVKALRMIGQFFRQIVTSDWWRSVRDGMREARNLPYQLMRDAGLEEDYKAMSEFRQTTKLQLNSVSKSPIEKGSQHPQEVENLYSAWTEPGISPEFVEHRDEENQIRPPLMASTTHDNSDEQGLEGKGDQQSSPKKADEAGEDRL